MFSIALMGIFGKSEVDKKVYFSSQSNAWQSLRGDIVKIANNILREILNQMPLVPPEAGGIIGGIKGQVCIWQYDSGYTERGCAYRPNVEYLNDVIKEWMDCGFTFMGIVHVHFGGSRGLSDSDISYIERIMRAMPDSIEKLYFPLVVQPQKQWICYAAYRNFRGEVTVTEDEIEVFVQGGEEVN